MTYGLSLYAVSRGATVKAKVALFKGGLIFLAACAVIAQLAYKFFVLSVPIFKVMGAFSLVGLVANSFCLYLLWRHRHEDVNMSSVWEYSRSDIASNLSVFVAARRRCNATFLRLLKKTGLYHEFYSFKNS